MSDYLQESQGIDIDQDHYQQLFKNYRQIRQAGPNIRSKPQSSRKSSDSVRRAIRAQQQKTLQTRMLLTQKQYAKARENNILLLKKLGEAQQQVQSLRLQIIKINKQRQDERRNLKREAQIQLKITQQNQFKEIRSEQISTLKDKLFAKQAQISRLQLRIKSLQLQRGQKQNIIDALKRSQDQLRIKIIQMQHSDPKQIQQDSRGTQLLQLQQCRKAVTRLVSLLKNTQQYKNFSVWAESWKQLTFLREGRCRSISGVRKCGSCPKQDEKTNWSPTACYKILLQIKQAHNFLSQQCIEQILCRLNRIYLQKQQQQISKIKQQYTNQIIRLKKKGQERYDELMARKQIQRLKKQLQQLRLIKKSGDNLQTLKNIGQTQDQLRLCKKQKALLQERLRMLEVQNSNYDRIVYLEGTLWMIDKILQLTEDDSHVLNQYQTKFKQRYSVIEDTKQWNRAINEVFQLFGDLHLQMRDKLQSMKDSTLSKINKANNNNN